MMTDQDLPLLYLVFQNDRKDTFPEEEGRFLTQKAFLPLKGKLSKVRYLKQESWWRAKVNKEEVSQLIKYFHPGRRQLSQHLDLI